MLYLRTALRSVKENTFCHKLFVANTLIERTVSRAHFFLWLPLVGNSKRFRMYLRVVIVHFLAYLSATCSRGAFRVVRCRSSVVNNFFKHLLLPKRRASLDQTWQECSLGGPLQNFFTEFDSIKNSGCHGNEIEIIK